MLQKINLSEAYLMINRRAHKKYAVPKELLFYSYTNLTQLGLTFSTFKCLHKLLMLTLFVSTNYSLLSSYHSEGIKCKMLVSQALR